MPRWFTASERCWLHTHLITVVVTISGIMSKSWYIARIVALLSVWSRLNKQAIIIVQVPRVHDAEQENLTRYQGRAERSSCCLETENNSPSCSRRWPSYVLPDRASLSFAPGRAEHTKHCLVQVFIAEAKVGFLFNRISTNLFRNTDQP